MPETNITMTPYMEREVEYAPTMHTQVMMGIMYLMGTLRILMRNGITSTATARVNTLAIYREEIRLQQNSGLVSNSRGPGFRPHIMRPPSSTAPVPEPGMPRASSGAKAPAAAELLPASEAAMPSMAPVPMGSSLLNFFCMA